jgi:HTH-type transcriptional regulator/antitoxin HigA
MDSMQTQPAPVAKDYLEWIKRFPLRPIRSDAHLREAFKVIDELLLIDESKLTPGQSDYLNVLSELVWRYEQERFEAREQTPNEIDVLKHLMQENDMTASDLGRLLGNRSLGAAILRRERQLSKANIVRLCRRFSVSADLFLREPRVHSSAA